MFIAAFAEVEIVGACARLEDPDAPVWSTVHLTNVEAVGAGTIAYDSTSAEILPHIHVSVGEKARSASGYTSHLVSARVQFLVEMVIVEVTNPSLIRPKESALYEVPILNFMS